MNNKNSENTKKSNNQLEENAVTNFPINSDLLNIPIMPQMDSISKNHNAYASTTPTIAGNDKLIKKNKKSSHNKK